MGAGRTEVARAIFGADPIDAGEVFLAGQRLTIHSPRDAVRQGLAYLSEDRKHDGLALKMNVAQNITLAHMLTSRSVPARCAAPPGRRW